MGWRSVVTNREDTLQSLALRYMGHAKYWPDIAALNDLKPPYLAEQSAPGVFAYGQPLLLPITEPWAFSQQTDPFLTDIEIDIDGNLVVNKDDLTTIKDLANLKQALSIRVIVEKQSLLFHPEYGCFVNQLLGHANRLSLANLASFYAKSAILEDPRVKDVLAITSQVSGDSIIVHAMVQPVYGEAVAFEFGL